MSLPRVLVARSGANPFVRFAPSSRVEIVEKVSHTIEPVEPDPGVLGQPADLVIFTSQVAVERAFADPPMSGLFRKALAGARLVAVGAVTAEALAAKELHVDLVAAGSAESALDKLPANLEGQGALLPCGEDAAVELPEKLRSRGASVRRVVLYRKLANPPDPTLERDILERPFAAFCATSPSAGSWIFAGLGQAAAERLRGTPAVVLGRFTRRLLEAHGVQRIEMTGEARFAEALALLEHLAAETVGT
jgi:uroporphyrinogen-III synthase